MQMTDPMNAFKSFRKALEAGYLHPQKGDLHSDLLVLVDNPNGQLRFTYALIKQNKVVANATFVPVDKIDGFPCFNSGYAVDESNRRKGYGAEVLQKSFDEMINGFKRSAIPHLYVEAVVSRDNEPSNKLATKLFSKSPDSITDNVSGSPAFHYVRKLY